MSVTSDSTDPHTPVVLVTGFLGGGKTTLLNRALKSPLLASAAVVINEFGSVPLDHLLSEASDDQIVVLENGCLCCTVFGDLLATLNRLYHARAAGTVPPFDRVIIETSGLADPVPVVQAFLSDPTLEGLYRLESVVTVFDAVNGPATLERHDQATHQLALADRVLLTKLDLIDAGEQDSVQTRLRQLIAQINPTAEVHATGEVGLDVVQLLVKPTHSLPGDDAAVLRWLNASADSAHAHESHHHRGPKIATFSFVREQPTSRYALELLLAAIEQNLGPALLRLKGLVHVADAPDTPAVIQGAQHLLHNLAWLPKWPSEDRSTRIVFITSGIERSELEEMIGLLDRVARRSAVARERAQRGAHAS